MDSKPESGCTIQLERGWALQLWTPLTQGNPGCPSAWEVSSGPAAHTGTWDRCQGFWLFQDLLVWQNHLPYPGFSFLKSKMGIIRTCLLGLLEDRFEKRFVKSVLSPRRWCADLVCPSVTWKVTCRHFLSVRRPSFSINPRGLTHLGTLDVIWFRDGKFMDHKLCSLHGHEFFWVHHIL